MLLIHEQQALKYYCYYKGRGFKKSKESDKLYITNVFRPYNGKKETYTFLESVDLKSCGGSLKKDML